MGIHNLNFPLVPGKAHKIDPCEKGIHRVIKGFEKYIDCYNAPSHTRRRRPNGRRSAQSAAAETTAGTSVSNQGTWSGQNRHFKRESAVVPPWTTHGLFDDVVFDFDTILVIEN